jgi:hypothetical protein
VSMPLTVLATGGQGVVGSNPAVPTAKAQVRGWSGGFWASLLIVLTLCGLKTPIWAVSWVFSGSGCSVVLVDEAAEDRPTLDR